jgi:16S rRNA (guanine527-N7)-methyltransferase
MSGIEVIKQHFALSSKQEQQFLQLENLYKEWNAQINVISRKDIDELYVRHVLHSLAIAKVIAFLPESRVLDIGTGGGFPGIPLAILFPETKFVLCDSIAKKIKVVTEVYSSIGLSNVEAIWGRADQVPGRFDFIVSRAVAPMTELVGWTFRKLESTNRHSLKNGWVVLKGGDILEEISLTKRKFKIHEISQWFDDPFFETKKVVYVGGKA